MPATIIDLDVLVPKDKTVKLGGKTYTLPAEIPTPLYLRLKHEQGQAADEDRDGIEDVYAQLLELFHIHQPDLEELPVGILQALKIIPLVYGGAEVPEEERPTKAKTRARTGKSNSSSQRTKRSASQTS